MPSRLRVPLRRLYVPDICQAAIGRGVVAELSGSPIWRWLSEEAVKPWWHRSWIFLRNPTFEAKAARGPDLYARE